MKGNQRVLAHLQRLLNCDLAAMDQFLLHARMFEDWGYTKLAARTDTALAESRRQTDLLLRRMLFFGSAPDLVQREAMTTATAVREMLRCDVEMQYRLVENLRAAMVCCIEEQDFQTQAMLAGMLRECEDTHVNWLEQQLAQIEAMGLENYLARQL
ncbi:MAG: bacterioferritin [Thiohalocapsa sp.]|jgi:bacterioferritin|uniref:bacterioferritin n=1 Tax=Thiohalocapsa sp. TaxID=2497641 RepID=UPI0025F8EFFB|nr:bacterioferritin [Thiohalocapsa sp.]MCG6941006.1 bacterioferritin [Thiohalocapsa sp.]